MINFLISAGLFLFLALVVSFVLSIVTPEDNLKIITKAALKNFFFLCLTIVFIGLVVWIITVFF